MTNEEFLKSITLNGEEWRDVIGYEGLYMISSYGRCVSLGRYTSTQNNGVKWSEPRLRAYNMVEGNYLVYNLWKENIGKHIYIHRLVATAFIGNPNNYPEVDHIDTNKTNNIASNLRWCTKSMNQLNPITRKRNSEAKKGNYFGPTKPVVRINPKNPSDIKFYNSASDTRKLDGFNMSHVAGCCRRERNLHGGYKWMWRTDYDNLLNQQCQSTLE